jgi:hypothetical protein
MLEWIRLSLLCSLSQHLSKLLHHLRVPTYFVLGQDLHGPYSILMECES